MSKVPQTRIGNKIVDAQPEPQPDRPDWLVEGSLVCANLDLEPDTYRGREGWLTSARMPQYATLLRGQPGIYMGTERVSVTDRKGNTTRKLIHVFFAGGGKFYAEPHWFSQYKGEK